MHSPQLNGKGHPPPGGVDLTLPVPVNTSEEEYVVPVKAVLQVVWRRLWLILLVMLVCVAGALAIGFLQTPVYEASIKILVGQEQQNDASSSNLGSDVQGLQQLTETVSEAVETRPVAEAVVRRLDLRESPEEFLEKLSVEQVSSTQFIEIFYRDSDPERARDVANAVGEEFSKQISDVSPSANAITATVWERSVTPEGPVLPNFPYYVLAALAVGATLGMGLAFLLEYLDDGWRSPEEVERISGVPNLGVVPQFDTSPSKKEGKI